MNLSDLSSADAGDAEIEESADAHRYLVAEAAGQRVAVPLGQAREIIGARAVTRLPGAPSWIAGLVNLRGTVLTVLDVSQRLGGAASAGPVLVVELGDRKFGLRVERVDGVSRTSTAEEAVDEARSAGGAVRGLVATGTTPALVLDLEALQRAAIAEA
ncbi:MAG TPA: chemotaxis protein CheW [Gemmatimonadaceae bacterium]|nr:chemotaxis protein CheW [Gemmatimonadaceae bacterium]